MRSFGPVSLNFGLCILPILESVTHEVKHVVIHIVGRNTLLEQCEASYSI